MNKFRAKNTFSLQVRPVFPVFGFLNKEPNDTKQWIMFLGQLSNTLYKQRDLSQVVPHRSQERKHHTSEIHVFRIILFVAHVRNSV